MLHAAPTDVPIEATPAHRSLVPFTSLLAWVVIAGAFLLPPHGSGIPMCPSRLMSGVPCPGCGLTRSVTCLAHADPAWSWRYHPFGGVALVIAVWFAVVPLVAPALHLRVAASRATRTAGLVMLIAFILHGVVRAGLWLSGDLTAAGGG